MDEDTKSTDSSKKGNYILIEQTEMRFVQWANDRFL